MPKLCVRKTAVSWEFNITNFSHLLPAVMALWPSFIRFGSSQFPKNILMCVSFHPHFVYNVDDRDKRGVGPHRRKLVSVVQHAPSNGNPVQQI